MESVKAVLETNNKIIEKLKQNDIDVEAVEFTFVTDDKYFNMVNNIPTHNINYCISIYRSENFNLVNYAIFADIEYFTDSYRIYSIDFTYHTKECQRLFQQILES